MPTPATIGGTRQRTSSASSTSQPVASVPFIRASAEHREPVGLDITRTLTGSDQDLSVFDIPAYGYVRSIVLLVQGTGGAGGSAVATENGAFDVIKNIALTEPNGAQIAQFNSGFALYLANKYGGYRDPMGADPKSSPAYSKIDSNGNFSFLLRIPLELNLRDGLGSLPNQNAAATFKLRLALAGKSAIYGTDPATTLPNVRVRAFLEAWDQPEAATGGSVNATTPPAMNTTQFWTTQVLNYGAGQQTLRLTRVGNYIRNLILIGQRTSSTRVNGDADFPDPLTVQLDTRPLDIVERNNFKNQMWERTGYDQAIDTAKGLDSGVFVYDFMHEFDGGLGRENRDLWLPTLTSTRLELQGNFAEAGTLTVLTNDVAVAGSVFI